MVAPIKRFCIRGHDTDVGRYPSSGRCKECGRMAHRATLKPLGPRLPFAPLGEWMKAKDLSISSFGHNEARMLHRYQHRGMTAQAADEWACRIGLHPFQVWGLDWFSFDQPEEEETA
jgi:hypothetical protein